MNVLTVNSTASRGGAAAIANIIHQEVNRKKGASSVFISGRGSRNDVQNVVSLGISSLHFLVNVFCYRAFGIEGALNQQAWRHILAQYYSWADVVHLHNVHGYYLPRNILVKLLKKPTIWTLHDYWLGTGRCAVPEDCNGNRRNCIPCPYPHRYPSVWSNRIASAKAFKKALVLRSSAQFISPSQTSRNKLISMGLPKSRFHVIENPLVDFPNDIFKLSQDEVRKFLKLPFDRRVMTFMANRVDAPAKGFAVLLEALSHLPNRHKWSLVVIGKIPNNLKRKALSKPVEICFTGPIEKRHIILKYLMATNCFVNPSYSETFGLANIEALAAGCKIVCSNIPAFREFNLGDFRFFDPGDSQELSRILIDMYDSCFYSKESRLSRTQSICDRFSVEKAYSLYANFYRDALALNNKFR